LKDEKNEFKQKIIKGKINIESLATLNSKEMAPSEKKEQRNELEKKAFNSRRDDLHTKQNMEDVIFRTCPRCKGEKMVGTKNYQGSAQM